MPDCKVSVIVPVYNASKYLRQCIDSILAQSFTDFELILVDDGSTDSTPSILLEYAAADSRIQIITQQNLYAGTARNTGKAAARGEYLVFWDSDDFFHPDALRLLYDKSVEDNADVCICSAHHYFDDLQRALPSTGFIRMGYVPKELPFSPAMVPDYILNITTAHPWNKMYRSAYIKDEKIDFQTTCTGDDIFFVVNAIARAKRITIVNKALVNYRVSQPDSLSGSLSSSPLTPIDNWITTRKSLIEHDAYPKKSFDNKILNTLLYFLHNINNWSAFCETVLYLQDYALKELDLTLHEEGYYTSLSDEECLRHLLSDSPEEFLAFFQNSTYHASSIKNGRIQGLRKKVKRLNKQKKNLELAAAELDRAKAELEAVRTSSSYRIGRVVTYIPRKIKQLFKKTSR